MRGPSAFLGCTLRRMSVEHNLKGFLRLASSSQINYSEDSAQQRLAVRLSNYRCGLRLSDETIPVAVDLRLGLNICEPHTYPCCADVCARGTYSLSCKK